MSIFVILGLLVGIIEAQGISTATPVILQKGGDLHLNVDDAVSEDFHLFEWNVNKTQFIVIFLPGKKREVSSKYFGRLAFPEKKYSVILMNVQEADSGVYSAKVLQKGENKIVAEYNVTVQDPASPVNLTVVSVDSRSSECNLAVTCTTQDSHINSTFRCDNQTCSQEGGEQSVVTNSGAILHIYLSSSSIICNHSNQVNWTKDLKMKEDFCLQPDGSESSSAGISVCLLKIILLSVGLIIMVSAVITVHLMEKLKKHK